MQNLINKSGLLLDVKKTVKTLAACISNPQGKRILPKNLISIYKIAQKYNKFGIVHCLLPFLLYFFEDRYSINIPMGYQWKGKKRKGWINVVNPFRATMILGTQGSGKSYSIYGPYIEQWSGRAIPSLSMTTNTQTSQKRSTTMSARIWERI